jgi:hypothetical protein
VFLFAFETTINHAHVRRSVDVENQSTSVESNFQVLWNGGSQTFDWSPTRVRSFVGSVPQKTRVFVVSADSDDDDDYRDDVDDGATIVRANA